MELREWLRSFKTLHDRARGAQLSKDENEIYQAQRDELARAVVAAQGLTVRAGETPRRALRVARAFQIDLDLTTGRVRATTLHLSSGGFGTLLAVAPPPTEIIGFTFKQPGSPEPLIGRCHVVEVQKRTGNSLVSFAFDNLGSAEQERIEMTLFDAVLAQFETLAK